MVRFSLALELVYQINTRRLRIHRTASSARVSTQTSAAVLIRVKAETRISLADVSIQRLGDFLSFSVFFVCLARLN